MLIGVDIIEIDRIKKVVERTPRFLDRVFTDNEVKYCLQKVNPYPSLAVRFAAKEALRKLHPALAAGVRFRDLEVVRNDDGKPVVVLHGEALRQCQEEGIRGIAVSLSHSRDQAIAAVIAEKG